MATSEVDEQWQVLIHKVDVLPVPKHIELADFVKLSNAKKMGSLMSKMNAISLNIGLPNNLIFFCIKID